jgi:choline dehydrogenase-like flavoprotein
MSDTDVIVVGSGAGGSAVAYRLIEAGLRVRLIEKGERLPDDGSTLDIHKVVHQGAFKSRETWRDGRGRPIVPEEYFNLGGKTKWYGAALLRYGEHEFEADAAHQCLPWPIGYRDLAPYYEEAERLLGVRRFDCEPDLARLLARLNRNGARWQASPLPMGLAPEILADAEEAAHFDGFASVRRLKADAEQAFLGRIGEGRGFELITGAAVARLTPDPTDPRRVIGVRLADGRTFRARHVILAAGAMHSPRLLQRHLEDTGLTSLPAYAQVGRNFKLHLLTAMLAVSTGRKTDLLRKTTLLTNPHLPHSSVQPLGFDGELIGTLVPRLVPRAMARLIGDRAYGFFLQTEDGSHPDNRVVAAANGADASRLDYDARRLEPALREHRRLVRSLSLSLLGAGYLPFSQRIPLHGTAHACGTLVAGDAPARSVVDREGSVHGLAGLSVADGSILPRSSRVNPSLTIYAWALRLADHLAQRLQRQTPA